MNIWGVSKDRCITASNEQERFVKTRFCCYDALQCPKLR